MLAAVAVVAILCAAFVLYWITVRRPPLGGQREQANEAPESLSPAARIDADAADDEIPDEAGSPQEGGRRQAGKLALLGDLAAGIAHEINNPLSIMVEEAGWIEDLLEEEELQESENLDEFKRALRQIKTQGARCKEVIQNLLSFGRKTSIKIEDVQLNGLIREVVRSYDKRIRSGNVEIQTHFAETLPACRLSSSEMQQVLLNLINNAIDALNSKGGRIDITTRLDGRDIVIDVSDNGPGIPKAHLDRIFDPFFTTKPVGKGTGLGLSICYGLIEKTGGEITVDSEAGAGTTFHVRIPWQAPEERGTEPREAATEAAAEEETAVASGAGALAAAPTVVLVVGDEVPFVEALGKRLAKRNLQPVTAFSAEEALEKLQRKRDIDVVVLDVKTPEVDGLKPLREIKAARPLAEVILLSAHTTVESAIEGIKLGAFDYLLKPCDVAQLVDQIAKAKRRKGRQEQKIMEARIKEITSRRI
jgi:signal transduction histidine kinase/ActR/RegA family two-component response regulator